MARKRKVGQVKNRRTRSQLMRTSKEFRYLVNRIRAKYLLEGKKCPSIAMITKKIAQRTKEEDIFKDEFIPL